MYRVVIVDDEEPVLDSFAFILEKNVDDFELCGKARSGAEAIDLISEVKPDLVFMDIQMPGIDGIDAITRIQKQYRNIVFILATAYERFDIAKKAIPLGVFSYLVKPISRKTLIHELRKVKVHLDEIRESHSSELQDIRFYKKTRDEELNRFLRSLIWKNPSETEWNDFSHLFSVEGDIGAIIIADVLNPPESPMLKDAYAKLTEQFMFKMQCFSRVISGRLMLFIPAKSGSEDLISTIDSVCSNIRNYQYQFGRGSFVHFSRLNESYIEAFRPFARADMNKKRDTGERAQMKNLTHSFLASDWSNFKDMLESFWLEEFNNSDFIIAKGKMVALFTLLLNEIDEDFLISQGFTVNPAEEIMQLKNVEEWQLWLTPTLDTLQFLIGKYKNKSCPKPLLMALELIHQKYMEPVQLTDIAGLCNVSTSYLSRLFSRHLDTNFNEYFNRYRIKQAVELLKNTNLSIKEISYKVGYSDPNYFSRIFRKYMNISPSDLGIRRINYEI